MNYIDMFILVLIAYAVFRGLVRGLVMQLASLAALVLGVYGALILSGFTAHHLARLFSIDYEYLYTVSLGITFIIVFILVNLVGKLLEKMVESAKLSLPNKIFGILFSVCKVLLITGVILLFIDRIDKRVPFLPRDARENSLFYKPVTSIARMLFPALDEPVVADDDRPGEFV